MTVATTGATGARTDGTIAAPESSDRQRERAKLRARRADERAPQIAIESGRSGRPKNGRHPREAGSATSPPRERAARRWSLTLAIGVAWTLTLYTILLDRSGDNTADLMALFEEGQERREGQAAKSQNGVLGATQADSQTLRGRPRPRVERGREQRLGSPSNGRGGSRWRPRAPGECGRGACPRTRPTGRATRSLLARLQRTLDLQRTLERNIDLLRTLEATIDLLSTLDGTRDLLRTLTRPSARFEKRSGISGRRADVARLSR